MPNALDRDFSRSRAVLIGTWDYRHLRPVPAAEHSFQRMRGLLTGPLCGSWPEERVSLVPNRARLGELPHELVLGLRDAADVALFYYVGHGQYDNDDRLCLALGDSSPDPVLRTTTSLTFDAVRLAFRASKAATKIAILDCCFAGLAASQDGRLAGADDMPRSPGFCLLMASGEFSTAWFENTAESPRPQTYFTKYLADLIEHGVPGRPASLALGPIFQDVAHALVRDGKPPPGSRFSDHAAEFVFARNRAHPRAESSQRSSLPGPARRTRSGPTGAPADSSPLRPDVGDVYAAALALEGGLHGVERLAEIEALYRTAADLGQPDAMVRLGLVVEGRTRSRLRGEPFGENSGGDIEAAMHWYRKAAAHGSVVGAFCLGRLYEDQLGDTSEAMKWYETAARDGHHGARAALDGLRDRLSRGLGPLTHSASFKENPHSHHPNGNRP
ncbi:caspase family protein [Streptomyces uncialis]|uniref:caspase, EACC1-associated type n=1 Tax=Streptomyces uncialis TaxID=1048205 RepID=UPI003868945C|nr:sel1 repeat family protein [Streptomyces uncialis]